MTMARSASTVGNGPLCALQVTQRHAEPLRALEMLRPWGNGNRLVQISSRTFEVRVQPLLDPGEQLVRELALAPGPLELTVEATLPPEEDLVLLDAAEIVVLKVHLREPHRQDELGAMLTDEERHLLGPDELAAEECRTDEQQAGLAFA